jgi:hypothetical protein
VRLQNIETKIKVKGCSSVFNLKAMVLIVRNFKRLLIIPTYEVEITYDNRLSLDE